jgi:hypothetical protein
VEVGVAYQVAVMVLGEVVDEPKEEEAWVVVGGLGVVQEVL